MFCTEEYFSAQILPDDSDSVILKLFIIFRHHDKRYINEFVRIKERKIISRSLEKSYPLKKQAPRNEVLFVILIMVIFFLAI